MPTREQFILRALGVFKNHGMNSRVALATFLEAELFRHPNDDLRKVLINGMKNLRIAMTSLREELDAIDS